MEIVAPVGVGLVVLLGVIALVWRDRVRTAAIRADWQALAAELGLTWEPGKRVPGRVHGTLDGVSVEVYVAGKQASDPTSRVTFTHVRARHDVKDAGWIVFHRAAPMASWAMFAAAERPTLEMDDPAFDARVEVHAARAYVARKALEPAARAAVLAAEEPTGGLVIDDEEVRWEQRGLVDDPALLRTVIEAAASVARALSGRAP